MGPNLFHTCNMLSDYKKNHTKSIQDQVPSRVFGFSAPYILRRVFCGALCICHNAFSVT